MEKIDALRLMISTRLSEMRLSPTAADDWDNGRRDGFKTVLRDLEIVRSQPLSPPELVKLSDVLDQLECRLHAAGIVDSAHERQAATIALRWLEKMGLIRSERVLDDTEAEPQT